MCNAEPHDRSRDAACKALTDDPSSIYVILGGYHNLMCSWTAEDLQSRFRLESWSPPAGFGWDSLISDFCCLACFNASQKTYPSLPERQRSAMLALRNATGGGAVINGGNAWHSLDPCEWYGVLCQSSTDRPVKGASTPYRMIGVNDLDYDQVAWGVTSIWPFYATLTGTLPCTLGDLSGALRHATGCVS